MTENEKRFRIEFTVDAEGWSDKFIKDSAIQELTCMVPFPEDISFSEVKNPWHTGTPTEEGWYLVHLRRIGFKVVHLCDGEISVDGYMFNVNDTRGGKPFIVKWQKIDAEEDEDE